MNKRIEDFIILQNKPLTGGHFVLTLQGQKELPDLKPGQFAEVRVDDLQDAFLRRPFSIHDVDYENRTIKLLIQKVGAGTYQLDNTNAGDFINLIYPLGKGFTLPNLDQKPLLVGGGCGVAPLLFLSKYLHEYLIEHDVLIGGRNSDYLLEVEEYKQYAKVHTITEDGSAGEKGLIIKHSVLHQDNNRFGKIYTCGPDAMMKAIAKYARKRDIDCEVSLENTMACGIGACLTCVVKTKDGNQCVCTEGPVFNTRELAWQI